MHNLRPSHPQTDPTTDPNNMKSKSSNQMAETVEKHGGQEMRQSQEGDQDQAQPRPGRTKLETVVLMTTLCVSCSTVVCSILWTTFTPTASTIDPTQIYAD